MKLIIVFLTLFINYSVWGQELLFVRVYDSSGKKIENGYVIAATDSLLRLEVKKEPVNIEITKIGSIKTKRSGGNNILIGSLSGAVLLGIVGALTANPDEEFNITTPAGDGAITGTIFGLLLGGATGAATIPFKNSKTFLINGDFAKWKAFQSYFIEGNDRKTTER